MANFNASKKLIAAILGIIAIWFTETDMHSKLNRIVDLVMTYIAAQGIVDTAKAISNKPVVVSPPERVVTPENK